MRAVHVLRKFCGSSGTNLTACCHKKPSKVQVRYSATVGCLNHKRYSPVALIIRHLGLGPTSKDFEGSEEAPQITGPLTKAHATELVLHLNDEERKVLFYALQEYQSNKIKEEFEGELPRYKAFYLKQCKVANKSVISR